MPHRRIIERDPLSTAQVRDLPERNLPAPLVDYDAYAADPALVAGVERYGAAWAADQLHEIGTAVGSFETQQWGELANEHPPVLRTYDRTGLRIDAVDFQDRKSVV